MGIQEPSYRLPVNVEFVALAIRDGRPDTASYIDLDTGGVFTLRVNDDGEPLAEGLDFCLRHRLGEHQERFVLIYPLTASEKGTCIAEFTEGVGDEYLKRRLLAGSKIADAFGAGEEILKSYPVLHERWRAHLAKFLLCAALELLQENSIEPQIIPGDKNLLPLHVGSRSHSGVG